MVTRRYSVVLQIAKKCTVLLAVCQSSAALARYAYDTPSAVKAHYSYLYGESVTDMADGSKEFHGGRLWEREGVNVLYVHGDRFEMAFQHGRLLSKEIADGSLVMSAKIPEHAIVNNVGSGFLGRLLNWYTEHFITEPILSYATTQSPNSGGVNLAEFWGLSEGSGVPVKTVMHAALGPEAAQVLLGKTSKDLDAVLVAADVSQCTDVVTWGVGSKDGGVVIGRNTDYPLNGYYDRHTTVIYYDPTEPGMQRHMTTTTAGFHNAGVVGYNESGIYVSVHTVPTTHVGSDGSPVFMIGQEVLAQARNFDEALALFKKAKPAAGWNYLLVSVREHRAATIEMANDGLAVRFAEDDSMVTTNHWLSAEMVPRYLSMNQAVDVDTVARRERALEWLARGPIDPAGAIALMGDKTDPTTGRVQSFPYTVGVSTTVSSSVWQPEQQKVYIATGLAPVSRNPYVELPTIEAFDPDSFATQAFEVLNPVRTGNQLTDQAEQFYIEARKAFEFDNDAVTALGHLEKAVRYEPANPALVLVYGLMAIRTGDFSKALMILKKVPGIGWDKHRTLIAEYYMGRILAHQRREGEARRLFSGILTAPDVDGRLKTAAAVALEKLGRVVRFRLKPTDAAIMMPQGDLYHYGGMFER